MTFCMSPAEDRRSARRQATREAILAAAEALILEHGYEGLKTKDLVERADVSERTVFNHFENLEAVALARIDEYLIPLLLDEPFPEGLDAAELPDAVVARYRHALETEEGRRQFEGFLRLAAALVRVEGEMLARQVVLTLIDIAGRLVDRIEAQYALALDQSLALRLFTTHLTFALPFGVLRGIGTMEFAVKDITLPETLPSVEELVPDVHWAFDQVVAGKPRL